MSKKTIKQRIALVAVSALTAGLFSVMSAPSATAADVSGAGELDFSTRNAYCTVTNSGTVNLTVATITTGSAVQLVQTGITTADAIYISTTGPIVVDSLTSTSGGASVASGVVITNNSITQTSAAVGELINLRLTGVGTATVSYAASATATVQDTLTITSVAACSNGIFSSTYSSIMLDTVVDGIASSNVDAATSTTAGSPIYLKIDLEDGNDAQIVGGSLVANATNGALLSWTTAGTAGSNGTLSSVSVAPTSGGTNMLRIYPSQNATTSTTVVTVTHGTSTVASKNVTFHGEQASIELVKVGAGRTSNADTGYVLFRYKDSAGNVVPGAAAGFAAASATTTITTGTAIKAPTTSSDSIASNASIADNIEAALGGKTSNGLMMYTCGSSSAKANFTIATSSTVNANTLTLTVPGVCAGGISTYTVSTDKASYRVGDIAVITIDAKDSSGNPVSDNSQLQAGSVSVGGGDLTYTILGTAAAGAAENFSGGKVSLRAQMKTGGTWNAVVAFTGAATTSATTGYSVTDGAVSNADVLKSIVALIASINKQIAALQKLILARR
jgi:hypothetical protein